MSSAHVQWTVAHPEIAVVNAEGQLFAMREGTTDVIAVHEGLTRRRALTVTRRPAVRFDVAEVNGLRLPVTLEVGADTLPDGRVVPRITRLESGTVTLDGDYRVSLRLATYHRHQANGVSTDQLVGVTMETDRGLVSYRTPALNAALYSHQVGDLMHWLTPTANGPVLSFRISGTNTVLGLGLVTVP